MNISISFTTQDLVFWSEKSVSEVTQYDLHIKKADRYDDFIVTILTGNPKSPFKGP